MDPICPLLMLGSDRHAVCEGFDADHRCSAGAGPDPLDRSQQLQFCLSPMHLECPHFTRHALASISQRVDGVPLPSPDVLLAPTRLVIDGDAGRLRLRSRPMPAHTRPMLAAVVVLAATSAGIASGTVQRLAGGLAGSAGDPAEVSELVAPPAPTSTQRASTRPSPSESPPATATPSPTAQPTSEVLPAQTYVVQPGDTLKSIADRYGSTVAALLDANQIADQNVIDAGQVLTIP